jgi:hypothetical protein
LGAFDSRIPLTKSGSPGSASTFGVAVSGISSVDDVPPLAAGPPKGFGTGRGCLTVVVVAVVLGIIVTIAAGAGQGRPPSDSAAAYVRSVGGSAIRVEAAVTDLQTAIAAATRSPSRPDLARLARVASAGETSVGNVGQEFATRAATGTVGDAEVELFAAANGLRTAISSGVSLAGGRSPTGAALVRPPGAALARLTGQVQNAVGEWNEAVRVIWRTAGASAGQPTIS